MNDAFRVRAVMDKVLDMIDTSILFSGKSSGITDLRTQLGNLTDEELDVLRSPDLEIVHPQTRKILDDHAMALSVEGFVGECPWDKAGQPNKTPEINMYPGWKMNGDGHYVQGEVRIDPDGPAVFAKMNGIEWRTDAADMEAAMEMAEKMLPAAIEPPSPPKARRTRKKSASPRRSRRDREVAVRVGIDGMPMYVKDWDMDEEVPLWGRLLNHGGADTRPIYKDEWVRAHVFGEHPREVLSQDLDWSTVFSFQRKYGHPDYQVGRFGQEMVFDD